MVQQPSHPACSSCPAVAGHRVGRGFRSPAPLHSLGDVPADPLPPTGAVRSAVFPVGSRRRYPHTESNPWTPDGHIAPPESGDPSCRQSRIISCLSLPPLFFPSELVSLYFPAQHPVDKGHIQSAAYHVRQQVILPLLVAAGIEGRQCVKGHTLSGAQRP